MIWVAAVGRTGSSCISRILHGRLGVDMGGPGKIDSYTPKGGFTRLGPWSQAIHDLRDGVISPKTYKVRLRELAYGLEEPWGWKHPFTALFPYITIEALQPDYIIWAYRDIDNTVESWNRHYDDRSPTVNRHEVIQRHYNLSTALHNREHLKVDMNGWTEEDYIESRLREYIEEDYLA